MHLFLIYGEALSTAAAGRLNPPERKGLCGFDGQRRKKQAIYYINKDLAFAIYLKPAKKTKYILYNRKNREHVSSE